MSVPRPILASAAVLTLAGMLACAEGPDPAGPEIETVTALAPGAGHRVAGSGHVEQAAGLREFTFHAVESPDGGVSGSYKVVLPNGLFFEVDVTCMSVDGDTGWVAGVIRDTNAMGVVVGSQSMFWATDGGEGAGTEDIVSIAAFNVAAEGADLAFCLDQPLELAPMIVTAGNVQVR